MEALEIGTRLVEAINKGREAEAAFVDAYYSPDIVSIEGQGSEEMAQRQEGLEAIKGKHAWFYDNNEVHSTLAEGPFVGHRPDQFAVRIFLDSTPAGGERSQMSEMALFTTKDGKIVQEEFLYLMA